LLDPFFPKYYQSTPHFPKNKNKKSVSFRCKEGDLTQ